MTTPAEVPAADSTSVADSSSSAVDASATSPASSAGPAVQFLQVIDENGGFCCSDATLSSLVQSTVSSPQSSAYALIGIMGCQSTGKSTLLNQLFGTQFRTMDAVQGRSQTTKGVWMDSGAADIRQQYATAAAAAAAAGSSPSPPSLILMDLEGTDSGERGEDRTTFERQSSLFALSLSRLLILNMWEHDIGRYTASNYGILKTVFEVNLSLFSPSSRTHLLFLVRDHIEQETPMSSLTAKLRTETERIWSEVQKPEQYRDAQVDSLFVFHFFALPHLKLQREQFAAGVQELRNLFLSPSHPQYLLADDAEGEKGSVPAEGFGVYVRGIWETIRANKELNLPSQKEMLAAFRCDEIIAQQTQLLTAAVKERRDKERWLTEYNPAFSSTCSELVRQTLRDYDALTQYYHAEIVARKREEMRTRCAEALEEVFAAQCGFLLDSAAAAFASSLSAALLSTFSSSSPDRDIPDDFYAMVHKAEEAAYAFFAQHGDEVSVQAAGVDALRVEDRKEELTRRMEDRTARERTRLLSRLNGLVEAKARQLLITPLAVILKRADAAMWDDILSLYLSASATIAAYLSSKAAAYRMTDSELHQYEERGNAALVSVVRSSLEQHSSMILLHMRRRFDRLFRYDEDGLMRKWRGSDDVRGRWKECQQEALQLLDRFATFRLPRMLRERQRAAAGDSGQTEGKEGQQQAEEEEEATADVLIPPARRAQIELEFPEEVEGALREAEAEQERIRESRRIPAWGLAMILILGWNEFMALLRNPLLLLLTVVGGGGLYALWSSGLLGPAQAVVMTALRQAVVWLEDAGISVGMLKDWLAADAVGAGRERARLRPGEDGIEMTAADVYSNGNSTAAAASNRSSGQRAGDKGSSSSAQPSGAVRKRVHAINARYNTIGDPTAVAAELANAAERAAAPRHSGGRKLQ